MELPRHMESLSDMDSFGLPVTICAPWKPWGRGPCSLLTTLVQPRALRQCEKVGFRVQLQFRSSGA